MKINGNILKAFDPTLENKQKPKATKDSKESKPIKGDTLNISSNQVKEAEFPSFKEAKNILKQFSKHIEENPETVKELHDKSSTENINFLLKQD